MLPVKLEASGKNPSELIFWRLPSGNEMDRKRDSQAEYLVDQPRLVLGTSQIKNLI